MKKIKLKTCYPCLIKGESETYEVDEGDLLEIENEDMLQVYPLDVNCDLIPFCIKTNGMQSCKKYSVYAYSNFMLVVLNNYKKFTFSYKECLSFGNDTCSVKIYPNFLVFENEKFETCCYVSSKCHDYKVVKIDSFACVIFDNKSVYAFNTQSGKITHFDGDELVIKDDEIALSKKLNDCENRIKNADFSIKNGKISAKNVNFEYRTQNLEHELTPYRFLEAIKYKDFSHAQTFLSSTIKERISAEQLETFFGNVQSFLPLSTTDFILETDEGREYVKVDFRNNFIQDISCDKLLEE